MHNECSGLGEWGRWGVKGWGRWGGFGFWILGFGFVAWVRRSGLGRSPGHYKCRCNPRVRDGSVHMNSQQGRKWRNL
ncbi:hypothetical protein E1H13_17870 [Nodosilinea sp. P-1105]|nr:hypothetical protein [Nodosilinea sp. P-1105]